MSVFAIDPGNVYSAYVIMDEQTFRPYLFGKKLNSEVEDILYRYGADPEASGLRSMAIEMVASYGMPVGATVFDTCKQIGRFEIIADMLELQRNEIFRLEEKMQICHDPHANDATIRQALADRFAPGVPNFGKGTKKEPGWFYGFRADIWQAYAVGVTYIERMRKERER